MPWVSKYISLWSITITILLVLTGGCIGTSEAALVGKWRVVSPAGQGTITFARDNSLHVEWSTSEAGLILIDGTFTLQDDVLKLTMGNARSVSPVFGSKVPIIEELQGPQHVQWSGSDSLQLHNQRKELLRFSKIPER